MGTTKTRPCPDVIKTLKGSRAMQGCRPLSTGLEKHATCRIHPRSWWIAPQMSNQVFVDLHTWFKTFIPPRTYKYWTSLVLCLLINSDWSTLRNGRCWRLAVTILLSVATDCGEWQKSYSNMILSWVEKQKNALFVPSLCNFTRAHYLQAKPPWLSHRIQLV